MKLILNAPCFPKKTYHVGNAISQIITDVFYRNLKRSNIPVKYVCHAWNLHGKSPENACIEEKGRVCSYEEILEMTSAYTGYAYKEKSFFASYDMANNRDLIEFTDIDKEFIKYTQDVFINLVEKGLIIEKGSDCFLDMNNILKKTGGVNEIVNKINIFPEYHKSTIIGIENTLNGNYPITKERVFTVKVNVSGHEYSLNPIFQSLIMPLYLSEKHKTDCPAYLLASGSGHSLLKWHFIRSSLSWILTSKIPYENLILHGSILGKDGKPLSKHSGEVSQPSTLYELEKDKAFVRYVLLKSISVNDVKLQIESSITEYRKVATKIKLLENGGNIANIPEEAKQLLAKSQTFLDKFMIKQAFEAFYLALRKTDIVSGKGDDTHMLYRMYKVFLSPSP